MSGRAPFISFEGNEGAGKSTQIARLAERLREEGHDVLHVREPGGTDLAEEIRRIIKHPESKEPMASETELLLIAASRAQLVQRKILPALKAGTIVLCDRYTDSTRAYQGYGRGLPMGDIKSSIQLATNGLEPDLTFFLNLPQDESDRRVETRDKVADRIEASGSDFFARVLHGYSEIVVKNPDRIQVIDATGTEEAVAEEIWDLVFPLLQNEEEEA